MKSVSLQRRSSRWSAQTLLPERWIIVNDGSTDKTADIVRSYAQRFPWIQLVHRPPRLIEILQARFTLLMQAWSELDRLNLT